ncbi:LapA family protein [Legionella londiniensis]|uniref:Lipopolysaccharide assembly protein A domain-containing protein n=1 Tax=Legionella londiniensis TaxID=45068 RepID=A0A0W0VRC5_9GAMM|nr:LapA family protein [Legionella londiniensis]KTD22345.1 hypothetical protein Llon_0563 [Legionella londiniensis]STX93081.1 Predicted membrane protein [Legionella londiniensis]
MRIVMIVFYLLLVLAGVSFAVLNAAPMQVNFYFTRFTLPTSLLLTLMFGAGMLLGYIICLFKYWRLKLEYRKLKSQLQINEKEIRNLRAIPLRDQH